MGRKLANAAQKYPQPINEESTKVIRLKFTPQPKSAAQEYYLESLREMPLTIGSGPAGCGKSFLAMAVAIEKLLAKDVEKIVLTRPVREAGESLGFLPGDMDSKIAPYLRPLVDAMEELIGPTMTKKLMDAGKIEFAPLGYMRGRSLNNCLPGDHNVLLSTGESITLQSLLSKFENGEKLEVVSMNTETGELENKPVVFAFKQPNQFKKLVRVTLETGETVLATPDHKLYTKNRGYVSVDSLNSSDELLIIDMRSAKVANIEFIDCEDDVFDITVKDTHNFFVNGVLSSNCYVICDESQNTTPDQMKLFVTRAGNYSYFVVNGDPSQCDLEYRELQKFNGENGLDWIMRKIRGRSKMINVIEFGVRDIQRSELVKELLVHLESPDNK